MCESFKALFIKGTLFFTLKYKSDFLLRYLDGRVIAQQSSPNECGIKIKMVSEDDNGEWKCQVSVVEDGNLKTGEGVIQVTVAVPPTRVYLRVNGEEVLEDQLVVKKDDQNSEVNVACVAEATRPKPKFKWFIGENTAPLDVSIECFQSFHQQTWVIWKLRIELY